MRRAGGADGQVWPYSTAATLDYGYGVSHSITFDVRVGVVHIGAVAAAHDRETHKSASNRGRQLGDHRHIISGLPAASDHLMIAALIGANGRCVDTAQFQ